MNLDIDSGARTKDRVWLLICNAAIEYMPGQWHFSKQCIRVQHQILPDDMPQHIPEMASASSRHSHLLSAILEMCLFLIQLANIIPCTRTLCTRTLCQSGYHASISDPNPHALRHPNSECFFTCQCFILRCSDGFVANPAGGAQSADPACSQHCFSYKMQRLHSRCCRSSC